jgi:hypothetical protein
LAPHRLTWPRQLPFGPGEAPCPASCAGRRAEGPAMMSRFPVAFRLPAFASWPSFARWGTGPPLRSAYRPKGRTSTGLPCSARMRCGRGGCPLYPGGGGAHTGGSYARPPPAASQRPAPVPRPATHHEGPSLRGISRGFKLFTRPAFPSPVAPGWSRGPLGFPRASHPVVADDACRGGDRYWALPELRHHQMVLLPT